MTPSLKGQIAWITGGGSGIGLAGAMALAQAGAHVVISGRNAATNASALAALQAVGGDLQRLAGERVVLVLLAFEHAAEGVAGARQRCRPGLSGLEHRHAILVVDDHVFLVPAHLAQARVEQLR